MQDMASATKDAAAMANQYGVSIEELSALIAIATSRTRQSGDVIGNSLKSIFVSLSDQTNANIVKAFDAVDVSMYKIIDGAKLLKTPIELLGELAEVFNKLPMGDDRRSTILNDIFGRYRANVGAAILQDWDSMQGIMETYERGAGSAMREAQKTVKTLNSELNILKNTGVDIVKNFFDSKVVADFVDTLNLLAKNLDFIIEKLGAIPTLLLSISSIALFKNGGIFKEIGTTISVIQKYLSVGGASLAYDTDIQVLSNALKDLSVTQRAAVLSTTELSAAEQAQVLAASGATDQEIAHALATNGLTSAKKIETVAEFENVTATLSGNAAISEAIIKTLGLSVAEDGRLVGLEALTAEEVIAAATQNGMNAVQATALVTTLGLQKSTIGLAASFKGLSASIAMVGNALTSIIAAHPILLAMVVTIGAISAAIIHHKKAMESLNSTLETAKAHLKEQNENTTEEIKTLNDLIATYQKLGQKTSLTTEEKNSLIDIQSQLAETYNVEERKIDVVNGKYEDQIQKLRELQDEKRKIRIEEARDIRAQNLKEVNDKFAVEDIGSGWGIGTLDDGLKKRGAKRYATSYSKEAFTAYREATKMFSDVDKQTQEAVKKTEKVLSDFHDEIANNPDKYGISDVWGATAEKQVTFKEEDLKFVLKYYQDMQQYLRDNLSYDERNNDYYLALTEYYRVQIESIENAIAENDDLLRQSVENAISLFSMRINGETIDYSNVTTETALAWKNGLIQAFAADDSELKQAIEDYYHYTLIPEINKRNQEVKEVMKEFNLSSWLEENEFDNIEKLFGKIQTAYKNLEEGQSGFGIDSELLKQFPELASYLDDAEALKEKLQEIANLQIDPLVTQLEEMKVNLRIDSDEYKTISNTIQWLKQQADVTQKVKDKTTKIADLYKEQKKQIHENIQSLEREIQTIDKQVSALEKKKKKQDEIVKALEKEKDLLEKQIKDYETAASTVKSVLDEQIKSLEKQKDSLKDGYDNQIKGIEETYKKQIELVKKQQENYDAQIKTLRDEADEQDRLNDLKEKELALEKAKNEKVRVYDSSKGWTIQSNSEEIAAKQKDLDKVRRDNEIARLEKEKESLEGRITALETERDNRTKALEEQRDREIETYEKQIKALNDYKDAWEKAKDSYQKAQDEMTTAAILGADWRQKALDKDMEIVNTYKTEYSDLQTKLKETLEPQIESAKKLADTYSEQADALKEQKDTYKELQDDQKKYLDFFKTYAEDMVKGTKDQKQAWDDFSEAIEKFTKISGFDNLKEFYDVAMQAYDEDYISTLLGGKATADKKTSGTTNTNQLSSLEQLLNNINNSGAAKAGYAPMFTGFLQQSFLDNVEKSQKVYEAFQNSSSLLDNSARNLGVVTEQMSKSAGNWTTNNRSYQDNRTINVNGVTVRMTEQEFTTYMNNYWKAMDRDSQVGKR